MSEQNLYDFSASDARTVDNDFKPMPEGEYLLSIEMAERKETNSRQGEQLKLELVVLESPSGQYQGRKVFSYHMIKHTNEVTQRIGREYITELAEAVGLSLPLNIQDTSQFLNKAVRAELKVKAGSGGYADSNEVKRYLAYQNGAAKPISVLPPPTTTSAQVDDIPF
jgi:hypothetical protein